MLLLLSQPPRSIFIVVKKTIPPSPQKETDLRQGWFFVSQ